MPKNDFNKVALQLYWNRTSAWVFSTVNLLHSFKIPFSKNTSGLLFLYNAETSWNFRKKALACVLCCIFIRFQISILSLNIVWLFDFDLNRRIKQNHYVKKKIAINVMSWRTKIIAVIDCLRRFITGTILIKRRYRFFIEKILIKRKTK